MARAFRIESLRGPQDSWAGKGNKFLVSKRFSPFFKPASCPTFRHLFATHLLEHGYKISTVQESLDHRDVSPTLIYTHVLNRGVRGVRSPADALTQGLSPSQL